MHLRTRIRGIVIFLLLPGSSWLKALSFGAPRWGSYSFVYTCFPYEFRSGFVYFTFYLRSVVYFQSIWKLFPVNRVIFRFVMFVYKVINFVSFLVTN